MNGPYTHTGSIPKTYEVVIKAVLPYQQTDPASWDCHALVEYLASMEVQLEVDSHELVRKRAVKNDRQT